METCSNCGKTFPTSRGMTKHTNSCSRIWDIDSLLSWGKVTTLGKDDCWIWGRGTYAERNAYPQSPAVFNGVRAHTIVARLSSTLDNYEGLDACHSCDNPPCVNPNHLTLGSRSDNIKDAVKKGRHKTPFNDPDVRLRSNEAHTGDRNYLRRDPLRVKEKTEQLMLGQILRGSMSEKALKKWSYLTELKTSPTTE